MHSFSKFIRSICSGVFRGQLFSGGIVMLCNFRRGKCPVGNNVGEKLSTGQLSGEINLPRGQLFRGQSSRGKLSGGQFSSGAIIRWHNCRESNCPGGSFPRGQLS